MFLVQGNVHCRWDPFLKENSVMEYGIFAIIVRFFYSYAGLNCRKQIIQTVPGKAHIIFPTNTILKSFAKQLNALGTSTLKKTNNSWKPVFLISLRPFKIIDGTFLDPENFKKLKIKNLFEGDFFVSRNSLNLYLNEVIPDDKYKILKKLPSIGKTGTLI